MMGILVAAGILVFMVLAAGGWAVGVYNGLISLRNQVEQAWANIDVLLKQRRDELDKLVDTVKGVKNFEQETLIKITEARSRASAATSSSAAAAAATAENTAIRGFFAVAEAYPELKSNQNFQQLQQRVSGIEGQIADRREAFNDVVNNYNTRIQVFPDSVFAGMLGCQRHEYFHASEEEKADVKVQF
jgi:LemA protein